MKQQINVVRNFFKNPAVKMVLKIIATLAIMASLLLNLFTHVIPVVKYYGNAMSPCLSTGQVLLVKKTDRVAKGDVIAFYYNNKVLVRRAVATSGDQVSLDIFGNVSVNNELLDEPYVAQKSIGQSTVEYPYNVPMQSVFVLGDNRVVSMDSRLKEIGAIPNDRIIGKVIFSIVPPKLIK